MVFVDVYFVVSDKKYVSFKDGVNHLTAKAKRNLTSCTLNICEQHIVSYQIAEKDCQGYACLYHTTGVDQRMLSFHPTYQAVFKKFLDTVADNIFTGYSNNQKKFIQILSTSFTTLCQVLWYWFDNHGIKYQDNFHAATKLHENYHTDIKNDAKMI